MIMSKRQIQSLQPTPLTFPITDECVLKKRDIQLHVKNFQRYLLFCFTKNNNALY